MGRSGTYCPLPLLADAPDSHHPRRPAHFTPERIILCKGSLATPERRRFVRAICALYPHAAVTDRLKLPHNRAARGRPDALARHDAGKRTLVFGEHNSAVRLSEEEGNTCPNYWHFSPYGFCPYHCAYCYLAGTQGVWFSPAVKIFVNLPEILAQVDRIARRIGRPTAFYLGKLQDGLALDPLTGYSRTMIPFFAGHPFARLTLLTKATDVGSLPGLDHRGRTILSWSLNPPEVCRPFEPNTPPPTERIAAMRQCAAAGYRVRAVIMPVIPIPGWRDVYDRFLAGLLTAVSLERVTLGGVCSYPNALRLMEAKLGRDNVISKALSRPGRKSADGRLRYSLPRRIEIYRHLIRCVRRIRPDVEIALCLEDRAAFAALGLADSLGRCNCVL